MNLFIQYLIIVNINISIGFLLIFLISGMLKNRVGFRWKHVAWILVIVCSLFPLEIGYLDTSDFFKIGEVEKEVLLESGNEKLDTFPNTSGIINNIQLKKTETYKGDSKVEVICHIIRKFINDKNTLLLLIWGVGVLIIGISLVNEKIKLKKIISDGVYDERLTLIVELIKKNVGYRKSVSAFVCSGIKSPIAVGVVKPKIYIPMKCEASEYEIENIIKHELYHFKNHDTLYKNFFNIVKIVFWFNPLVHIAIKNAFTEIELICDSKVVLGMSNNQRKEYCNSILRFVPINSSYGLSFKNSKKNLEKRIDNCFERRNESVGVNVSVIIGFLMLMIFLMVIVWNSSLNQIVGGKENEEIVVTIKEGENFTQEEIVDDFIEKKEEGSKIKIMTYNMEGENYFSKEIECNEDYYECNGKVYNYFLRLRGRLHSAERSDAWLVLCNKKVTYKELTNDIFSSIKNGSLEYEVVGAYTYY